MFCEYCELANKINPDKSSKEARPIHEKYRVIMELNGKQERCTCNYNSYVLRTEL
jgi:hypothetical protein